MPVTTACTVWSGEEGRDPSVPLYAGPTLRTPTLRVVVEGPSGGRVTLSVGAATVREGETPDELLARADASMYDDKSSSKVRRSRYPTALRSTRTATSSSSILVTTPC